GQLSAALAAMQELDLPRVAVISLAKRIEEVFVPGRPNAILLSPQSPGLQLLQRVRDEAHRFAITFHRQRRDLAARGSMFDQLEGVGPARRRALLQHFGSAEGVVWAVVFSRGTARALQLAEGSWQPDTSGLVKVSILGPHGTAAATPQVAAELSANAPLVESGLWVDGVELLAKGGGLKPNRGTI